MYYDRGWGAVIILRRPTASLGSQEEGLGVPSML